MKSLLLAVSLLVSLSTAYADGGSFRPLDGGPNQDLAKQVRVLQQEVGNLFDLVKRLDDRVSTLESNNVPAPTPVTYTCSLVSNFNNTYVGTGSTQVGAAASAVQQCTAAEHSGMFCKATPTCSSSN